MTDLQSFFAAVSAIVLFVYGLQGLSRELRTVGGGALQSWLTRVTASRWLGFAFGALATAIVQSSSAVTSLTTAFVDASIISFRASLGVLLGSNVGTTTTAWLVSLKLTGVGPFFIVLGKLSGRNAFKQRLEDLGVQMESEADINTAFAKFKELADRKSEIFDEDILALVSEESVTSASEQFAFVSLSQHSETGERPHASVVFTVAGKEVKGDSDGNGPVDASLKAIESHVKSGAEMVLYSVNAISGSTESQGEVTVRLQNSGRVVNGVGSDPDIVVASAKAYLSALNKLQSKSDRVAAQG